MKCITLSSGKQVCFDSTSKFQPGGKTLVVPNSSVKLPPLSKEQQLAQNARTQGDIKTNTNTKSVSQKDSVAKQSLQEQKRKAEQIQKMGEIRDPAKEPTVENLYDQDIASAFDQYSQGEFIDPTLQLISAPIKGMIGQMTGTYGFPSDVVRRFGVQQSTEGGPLGVAGQYASNSLSNPEFAMAFDYGVLGGLPEVVNAANANVVAHPGVVRMGVDKPHFLSPTHYRQVLKISNNISPSTRAYLEKVINTIEKQGGNASQAQFDILNRFKRGDFNFGPKGRKDGGFIKAQEGLKATSSKFNIPKSKKEILEEQARSQGDISSQMGVKPNTQIKQDAIALQKIKEAQEAQRQQEFYDKSRTELNPGKADIRSAFERNLDQYNLGLDQLEQQGRLAPGLRDFMNMGGLDKGLFLMGSAFEPMEGVKSGFVKDGNFIPAGKMSEKNLFELIQAKKFADKYGYTFPKNLDRISNSELLTDRTVRGLMRRHNTLSRGVSTNWDTLKEQFGPYKWERFEESMKDKGIDYRKDPEAAARVMGSEIPFRTNYGRVGLKGNEDALYMQNSLSGSEGYTYGDGYIVISERPTDFSSPNRLDWITKNEWNPSLGFKNSSYGKGVVKTDYIHRVPPTLRDLFTVVKDPVFLQKQQNLAKNLEKENSMKATQLKAKYQSLSNNIKLLTDAQFRKKDFDYDKNTNLVRLGEYVPHEGITGVILKDLGMKEPLRDVPNLLDKSKVKFYDAMSFITGSTLSNLYHNSKVPVGVISNFLKTPEVYKTLGKNLILGPDAFSHYVFKGTPGEQAVIPMKTIRIDESNYLQKSRAHAGNWSKGLTRREDGGKNINNTGYLDNSDTKHNPYNVIPSNNITMDGVSIPLLLMPDGDKARVVMPHSGEYNFPNSQYVTEIPLAQRGRVNNIPAPTTQDSLLLYNNQLLKDKFYKNNPNYKIDPISNYPHGVPPSNADIPSIINDINQRNFLSGINNNYFSDYLKHFRKPLTYKILNDKFRKVSDNIYSAGDILSGSTDTWFHPDSPPSYFSDIIKPQRWVSYVSTSNQLDDYTDVPMYDPLAIKPFHMRTPQERIEWEKKYGTPKSKPVVKNKPTQTKKSVTKQELVQPRETLEPLQSREVPGLTSNFNMEPRSISVPSTPQSSDEESNRKYSIRIPTVDIIKRQVAPRVNRVLGKNIVNPKNQYQRSIEFGSREIPIIDDYNLNKGLIKMGMEPRFQPGGQAVKKGPGPFLIPESRPQFKSIPVDNLADPRLRAYQDSVIQNNKSIEALQNFNKAYNTKQPYVATPENLTDDYKNSGVKQQAKYTNPKNTKNYLQPSKKIDDLNEEQRANLLEAFNTQQEGTPINLPTALYYGDLFNNSTYRNEDIWFDYHTNPVQPYHLAPLEPLPMREIPRIRVNDERPLPNMNIPIPPPLASGTPYKVKTEGLTVPIPTVNIVKETVPPRVNAKRKQNKVNVGSNTKTKVKFDIDQREILSREDLDSLRGSVGLDPKGYQPGGKTKKQYTLEGVDISGDKLNNNYGFFDWLKTNLNPYNWGVDDYSEYKTRNEAYEAAKRAGKEEFMYNHKRFNTEYDGTPGQEIMTYGINGKPVVFQDDPAQVNVYPMFSDRYLPGHIAASITNDPDAASINYSSTGNNPLGLANNETEKDVYYVYGIDKDKFYNKASSLPTGDYMLEDKYTPSDWNLITNNCADNVCDAFGIPRSKGIQTPSGAMSKIKEKYPTLNVTGRTKQDYLNKLSSKKYDDIIKQANYIKDLMSSPEAKEDPGFRKALKNILDYAYTESAYYADIENTKALKKEYEKRSGEKEIKLSSGKIIKIK